MKKLFLFIFLIFISSLSFAADITGFLNIPFGSSSSSANTELINNGFRCTFSKNALIFKRASFFMGDFPVYSDNNFLYFDKYDEFYLSKVTLSFPTDMEEFKAAMTKLLKDINTKYDIVANDVSDSGYIFYDKNNNMIMVTLDKIPSSEVTVVYADDMRLKRTRYKGEF